MARVSLIAESNIDSKMQLTLLDLSKLSFMISSKLLKIAPEVLASIDAEIYQELLALLLVIYLEIDQKQEILETVDFQLRAEFSLHILNHN